MGSATSGASERANSDAQALWEFLYNNDPNLTVSGGRTGNATSDFTANKTIALPDSAAVCRRRLMTWATAPRGGSRQSFFGASGIVLGNAGGAESTTLDVTQIPPHAHPFTGNQISLGTLNANQSFVRDTGGGTASAPASR